MNYFSNLSPHEQRQLAELERVFADDVVLAAVAELFVEPNKAQDCQPPQRNGRPVPRQRQGGVPWCALPASVGVACAIAGLALGPVVLVAVGIVLLAGTTVALVITEYATSSRFVSKEEE